MCERRRRWGRAGELIKAKPRGSRSAGEAEREGALAQAARVCVVIVCSWRRVHPCVCVLISSGPQQQEHQRKCGLSFLCLSHCHNTHEP